MFQISMQKFHHGQKHRCHRSCLKSDCVSSCLGNSRFRRSLPLKLCGRAHPRCFLTMKGRRSYCGSLYLVFLKLAGLVFQKNMNGAPIRVVKTIVRSDQAACRGRPRLECGADRVRLSVIPALENRRELNNSQ